MERSNFHDDDLKHYLLKAQNAREDGYKVGCMPSKKASKSTLKEIGYKEENVELKALIAKMPARVRARLGYS